MIEKSHKALISVDSLLLSASISLEKGEIIEKYLSSTGEEVYIEIL
jgi:hypothetical protein